MALDLQSLLPELLPAAIAWAECQAQRGAELGQGLTQPALDLAKSVGVRHPELIRIQLVGQLPFPEDPPLQAAALQTGLLSPRMKGLTLGHSLFIVQGHDTPRLLSHEFRHVHQYETFGSIAGFLPVYLQQIVVFGYDDAPLEIDARAYERDIV